ncbi:winged helix-turn-helix domain-containing protein [Stenotrophomonas lactitubi]|uniref:winged helix-turn-helix domain-containing protein n=1 Tax=Stenotrophomonas lactitubi TaxID=2045214 RepID=UPI003208AB23
MAQPWPHEARTLQIGDLTVDLRYRRLISGDESVELQQRVFELLLLLMSEPDKLFTRNELFDRLWSGLVVDDANLSQSVWLLRRALGETRREWIRTVAKRGYVFSPPGPITWQLPGASATASIAIPSDSSTSSQKMQAASVLEELGQGSLQQDPVVMVVDTDAARTPEKDLVRSRNTKRWSTLLVAVALVTLALVVGGSLAWMGRGKAPSVVSVALLDVSGNGNDEEKWAAALLREWLAWKLGSLPQFRLIDPADLSGGKDHSPQMILFSATPTADGKQTLVRARIQDGKREQYFQARGSRMELPALIDRISNEVMQHLSPGGSGPWPALEVDAAAAQHYQAVALAYHNSDWMKVISQGKEVLAESPRFGLMHLQIAEAQSRLDLMTDAMHHMELAIRLLRPLPAEAEASLQARRLELDPRKSQEADRALVELRRAYPYYAPYRQRHVELLLHSGRPKDALALLNASRPDERSPMADVLHHLQLADAAYAMGDPELSERHARQALSLASKGKGMPAQQGDALLLLGYLKSDSAPLESAVLYRRAAERLQTAGNATRSLYASTMARISSAVGSGDTLPLKVALEDARDAGAPWLEVNILITLANHASSEAERSRFLRQALDVERQSGNLTGQGNIEAALAMEDVAQLRLTEAHERAVRMQALGLEGASGSNVGLALAMVYSAKGEARRATEALDAAVKSLPPDAGSSNPQRVELACMQSGMSLRLADDTHLNAAAAICRAPADAQSRFWGRLMDTSILLDRGDLVAAREEYQKAVRLATDLQNTANDRAELPIAAAYRELRLGEQSVRFSEPDQATAWFHKAAEADGSPNPMLTALLEIGYAEASASRGQWPAAARYAAQARSRLPSTALELLDRLDLLDLAAARAAGRDRDALDLARRLYRSAAQRGEVRVQLLVLHLVGAAPLGLHREELAGLQQVQKQFPGMSLTWLPAQAPFGRREEVVPGSIK